MPRNGNGFFDYDPDELNFVPFDIETTGFKATEGDFITNVVLFNDDQYHIWLNTNGDNDVDVQHIYKNVTAESGLDNIVLYVCETEKNLLQNIGNYLDEHTGKGTILTAFNGETFRGDTDFDVPFLRTRCFRNGLGWILSGYWYTDSYEILSQQNRFDTTVKAEPSLEDMKKSDLIQFVKDVGFDIHIGSMKKAEIVDCLKRHQGVNKEMLWTWANNNNISLSETCLSQWTYSNISKDFNKSDLKDFIDSKSVGINYDKHSKSELIKDIRDRDYSEEMLVEWHEQTGRSIGTTEITDLDGIHRVMIEDRLQDGNWRQTLPFDVEVFEPFDPYESSGEAVTGYMDGDYTGVILHCFADVARTVNLTNMMAEYAPQNDYRPKTL